MNTTRCISFILPVLLVACTTTPTTSIAPTSEEMTIIPTPPVTAVRFGGEVSFTVSPSIVKPGEAVVLTWTSSEETTSIEISESIDLPDEHGILIRDWSDLPPNGELRVDTYTTDRDTHTFALTAMLADPNSVTGWGTITLHFTCPYTYFFSPAPVTCPDGPVQSQPIVEQSFENGRMVWIKNGEHDTANIYILFSDGQASKVFDGWIPDIPEPAPALKPPAGRYQPIQSLGKAWRESTEVQGKLGWAIAPEQTVTAQYQTDSRPYEYKNSRNGLEESGVPSYYYRPETIYMSLADRRIVKIVLNTNYNRGGEWQYFGD